ncbi:MAG: UDP-N-acetylmuramoyl-L-alanyl-D-glutamate--2,6-diaminopimelate ligase, partial [Solirubrobacteraceae bacterium]
IIAEIMAGISAPRGDVEAITDRREAIDRAVALAAPGDVLVIAGKGHEQGQELADGRKVPFDDVTVAAEALDAPAPGLAVGGGRSGLRPPASGRPRSRGAGR